MSNDVIKNIPEEQPPRDPKYLPEWLARMMILINGALSNTDTLDVIGQMPSNPTEGMMKYFPVAIEPDILYPGPWMYIEGEWASLNKRRAVRLIGIHVPDQIPTGTDVPLQLMFGDSQVSSDGAISLGADGTITFLKKAIVDMTLITHYTRNSNNNECFLIFDTTFNGSVASQSLIRSIGRSDEPEGFELSFSFSGVPDDEVKFWLTRDPQGTNDGYLRTFIPTSPIHPLGYGASITIVREV